MAAAAAAAAASKSIEHQKVAAVLLAVLNIDFSVKERKWANFIRQLFLIREKEEKKRTSWRELDIFSFLLLLSLFTVHKPKTWQNGFVILI